MLRFLRGGGKRTKAIYWIVTIATVVTFLASRRNSYTTGANVNVDGGSDFT